MDQWIVVETAKERRVMIRPTHVECFQSVGGTIPRPPVASFPAMRLPFKRGHAIVSLKLPSSPHPPNGHMFSLCRCGDFLAPQRFADPQK